MEKLGIERIGDDTSERGLATSRRSPEEDRWQSTCFDEFPDSFSWSDEMRLSYEIIEA